MINHITLLRNIGAFDSDNSVATLDLKRLSLIYGDNARGKTTLAAVLRSLGTGNPLSIEERQRLGAKQPPHIVFECEGDPSTVIFQNGSWNRTIPDLKIFDDVFVDENVHSGLDVESQHRQNLHELILGDQGVALNRRLQNLVSRIAEHNVALDQKSKAVPEHERHGLSVDEFCGLSELPDVEDRIQATDQKLNAVRNQDAVRTTDVFQTIDLPRFDIDAITKVLAIGLQDLDQAAEARVQAHVQTLGAGGESWVAEGMRHLEQGNSGYCPFCGRDITGLDLVDHYRAYFSEGYARLKQDVAAMIKHIDRTHAEGTQTAFERAVGVAKQTGQFWGAYCDLPQFYIDTESIIQGWNAAYDMVTSLLKAKQAAPLEQHEVNEYSLSILAKFDAYRHQIKTVNETLVTCNESIVKVKQQSESADVDQVRAELARLKASKARFSSEVAPLCTDYLNEKEAKTQTETARTEARAALEEYRNNVFPALQDDVNAYLRRFNASFRIESLKPTNIGTGTGSTCTYNVVINNMPIAVRNSNNSQGKPSFRNSLSAGDRNTLALALFFSSLSQNPSLANTVVVIDDPMSSLDDQRSLTTVQAIRRLTEKVAQVIVLSHNKKFLCSIWNGVDRKECCPLEIVQNGEESTIQQWDVSQDAITEHDQRHVLLRNYADTQTSTKREVAVAIRPHLEGFLRVACPGSFPPAKLLGPFIQDCHSKVGTLDEVLSQTMMQELQELVEYGNRFHHDTNPAWETADINATELLGFVKRTLDFVRPSTTL